MNSTASTEAALPLPADWLLGKNNLSAEKMAYYQYKFMPEELKKAFQVVHATPGGVASKKTASLQ